MTAQEPCRFRIGEGRKVHEDPSWEPIAGGWFISSCGIEVFLRGDAQWLDGDSVAHPTTDPVDCETCLRALAARDGS